MLTFETLYQLMGKIKVSADFNPLSSYILHISDTPSSLFRELSSVIKKTNPKVIIHTGDLVDDIKLEFYRSKLFLYEKYLEKLVSILENSSAEKIYYVLGNHDDLETLKKFSSRGIFVEKYSEFNLYGIKVGMCHKAEEFDVKEAKYVFFGHSLDVTTHFENGIYYYNGIENITFVDISSKNTFHLRYPYGTDDFRLNKHKINSIWGVYYDKSC